MTFQNRFTRGVSFFCAAVFALLPALGMGQITVDTANPYTFTGNTTEAFTLNSGWVIHSGGDYTSTGTMTIGAYGQFNITAGTLAQSALSGDWGFLKTGAGTLSISTTPMVIGNTGSRISKIRVEEGSVVFSGNVHLGGGNSDSADNNSMGVVEIVGGSMRGAELIVSNYAAATYNQTMGSSTFNSVILANWGPGRGIMTVSGGTFSVSGAMNVGQRGVGKVYLSDNAEMTIGGTLVLGNAHHANSDGAFYQSGGVLNANGGVKFGRDGETNPASKGAFYLSGGELNTTNITKATNNNTPVFEISGGTLNAQNVAVPVSLSGGTLNAATISAELTQTGGVFSPGGDDFIGKTTISAPVVLDSATVAKIGVTNLAVGREASQSTTNGSMVAGRAFDGIIATKESTLYNIAHTAPNITDGDPWLMVDLGDMVTVGGVNIYYRENYGGFSGQTHNRITNSDSTFYFVLYDEDMTEVWRSLETYGSTQRPQYISFENEASYGTGRYLSFVRDLSAYTGSYTNGDATINMTELEVFALEEPSKATIRLEIDATDLDPANWKIDELLFGAGGSLDLSAGNAILEIAFLGGIGGEGDWQIFNPADLTNGNIEGSFSEIILSTPNWKFTEASLATFSTTGMLSTQASGGSVPEPATWAMLLLGMAGMWAVRRKRG